MHTCIAACSKMMDNWRDAGLFVLRVVLGGILFLHGWQKLTVFGVPGTTGFLAGLGFPIPQVFAVLLIAAEVLGGAALVLGLYTHWAAKIAVIVAVVAFFSVHMANGFFINPMGGMQGYGFEYILLIFAAAFSLMISGGGRYSLDAKLMKAPSGQM